MLDVAGGTGGLAVELTTACPNLRATVVDLPSVTPTTQKYVDEAGAGDRVRVVSADVVTGHLEGSYDVAVVSAFIPVIAADDAQRALKNVGNVIEPGGTIYLTGGSTIDDSRSSPPDIALNGQFFINAFDEVSPKTENERRRWLVDAGFEDIQQLPFPEGGSSMVAQKQR